MNTSQTVHLEPAFRWSCPRCFRDQFASAIRHAQDGDGTVSSVAPETVHCPWCEDEYSTEVAES